MTKSGDYFQQFAPMSNDATMRQRKEHLDPLAVSLLLGCFLFWGLQQSLVKVALNETAPFFQAGLRFFGSSVLLLLWCHFRGVRLWSRDGSLRAGIFAGALFAVEFVCIFLGLQYSGAARVSVFLYTSPLWVAAALHYLLPSERLVFRQWLGLFFAFSAVLFTLREGFLAPAQPSQWIGDALGLLAGLFWGMTTVVIRTSSLIKITPEKLLMYQVGFSGLTLPLVSLAIGETWNWSWSTTTQVSMALQIVVGAFLTYLIWMWILGRYPATKVSVFTFLTPVFALIFGALWLGEPVTLSLLAALALVGAGIILVNRKPAKKP